MRNLLNSLLACTALGIVPAGTASADDLKASLSAANAAWNQALNSGNAAALAAQYAEDATLSPGNGLTLHGRAAIQQLFQGFVDNGVHNHTIDIVEVRGNGQLAYQVSRWHANGAPQNGTTPAFGGILMSVLEKRADGQWQIRAHVWNLAQ